MTVLSDSLSVFFALAEGSLGPAVSPETNHHLAELDPSGQLSPVQDPESFLHLWLQFLQLLPRPSHILPTFLNKRRIQITLQWVLHVWWLKDCDVTFWVLSLLLPLLGQVVLMAP